MFERWLESWSLFQLSSAVLQTNFSYHTFCQCQPLFIRRSGMLSCADCERPTAQPRSLRVAQRTFTITENSLFTLFLWNDIRDHFYFTWPESGYVREALYWICWFSLTLIWFFTIMSSVCVLQCWKCEMRYLFWRKDGLHLLSRSGWNETRHNLYALSVWGGKFNEMKFGTGAFSGNNSATWTGIPMSVSWRRTHVYIISFASRSTTSRSFCACSSSASFWGNESTPRNAARLRLCL